MAELKHTFTSGRMNKDLDDRLVPNGEYIDALNIQISSSEGSDVGAIENLLGNKQLSDLNLTNAVTIGSISYGLKNKIYWFVTSDNADVVLEFDEKTRQITTVLRDAKSTETIELDSVVLTSNVDSELIIENFIDSSIINSFNLQKIPLLTNEEEITNSNVDLTCEDPSISISIPKNTIVKRDENNKLVFKNIIYDYSTYGNIDVTATYTNSGILNFSKSNKITGINIVDDMLFWTDNLNQPRKIYIPKFKKYSLNFPNEDTKIEYEVKNQQTQVKEKLIRPFTEDDILVIKKSPINAPSIELFDSITGGLVEIQKSLNLFNKAIGDIIKIENLPENPIWQPGDFVNITSEDTDIIVQANVKSIFNDPAINNLIELTVVTIENETTNESFNFDISLKQKKSLYELNFARFAYRWKYKDGEYSSISPFSVPAFIADEFKYDGKEAFNHGMINKLQKVVLFSFDIPGDDVAEIDILFKETRNNNIYVYETKKKLDFEAPTLPQVASTVVIEKEKIHSIIPNDQLLRAWDNVPRKAKAQDVTANRIIYGNYVQNYDVYNDPIFNIGLTQRKDGLKRTIKSDRNYQLGVVYMDEYNRQTPVLSGDNSSKKIDKANAVVENKFTLQLNHQPPAWAKYFKYYIKDNSGEYYNIAVDRFYQDIENGFTYVSVPSSDRNKVTNEHYLLLKKKHGANEPVLSKDNRYKIIDIFNEPPEFITNRKREIYSIGDIVFTDDYSGSGGGTEILQKDQAGGFGAAPTKDYNVIQIKGASGGQNNNEIFNGVPLEDAKQLKQGRFIRFTFGDKESDIYEIKSVQQHPAGSIEIKLTVTEPFGEDVEIIWQKASPNYLGTTSGVRTNASGVGMLILEEYSAAGDKEFDGRFFIKLKTNATLTDSIVTQSIGGVSYLAKDAISLNGIYPKSYDSYRNDNNYNNSARYKNSALTDPPNHFVVSDGGSTTNGSTAESGKYSILGGLEYNITLEQSTHRNDGAFDQITRQIKVGDFVRFKNPDGSNHHETVYEIGSIRYHNKNNQKQGGTRRRTIKCVSIRFIDEDGEFKALDEKVCVRNQNTTGNEPVMEILQKLDNEKIIIKEPAIFETEPLESKTDLDIYYETEKAFDIIEHGQIHELDWYNAITFGNGVESNRIRDDFNSIFINNGVRASAPLAEQFKEEHKFNGLIWSGIINSRSGVNQSNQFNVANPITKDLLPSYGSIQKLFSRDNDIVIYCEDKIVKALADKDILYNADGSSNLVASNRVIGDVIPFNGEYGISEVPESFAFYGFRAYNADPKRGVILRLSMDGLTVISANNMNDFFRDRLNNNTIASASYDSRNKLYNISFDSLDTVCFSEGVNGWVSRKSFIPENGVSLNNSFYSYNEGEIWEHDSLAVFHNNFYGEQYISSVDFIINDNPSVIKKFKTLGYEGTSGWKAKTIETDQVTGKEASFIEKENKYFANITQEVKTTDALDQKNFSTQGIGRSVRKTNESDYNIQIGNVSNTTATFVLNTGSTLFNAANVVKTQQPGERISSIVWRINAASGYTIKASEFFGNNFTFEQSSNNVVIATLTLDMLQPNSDQTLNYTISGKVNKIPIVQKGTYSINNGNFDFTGQASGSYNVNGDFGIERIINERVITANTGYFLEDKNFTVNNSLVTLQLNKISSSVYKIIEKIYIPSATTTLNYEVTVTPSEIIVEDLKIFSKTIDTSALNNLKSQRSLVVKGEKDAEVNIIFSDTSSTIFDINVKLDDSGKKELLLDFPAGNNAETYTIKFKALDGSEFDNSFGNQTITISRAAKIRKTANFVVYFDGGKTESFSITDYINTTHDRAFSIELTLAAGTYTIGRQPNNSDVDFGINQNGSSVVLDSLVFAASPNTNKVTIAGNLTISNLIEDETYVLNISNLVGKDVTTTFDFDTNSKDGTGSGNYTADSDTYTVTGGAGLESTPTEASYFWTLTPSASYLFKNNIDGDDFEFLDSSNGSVIDKYALNEEILVRKVNDNLEVGFNSTTFTQPSASQTFTVRPKNSTTITEAKPATNAPTVNLKVNFNAYLDNFNNPKYTIPSVPNYAAASVRNLPHSTDYLFQAVIPLATSINDGVVDPANFTDAAKFKYIEKQGATKLSQPSAGTYNILTDTSSTKAITSKFSYDATTHELTANVLVNLQSDATAAYLEVDIDFLLDSTKKYDGTTLKDKYYIIQVKQYVDCTHQPGGINEDKKAYSSDSETDNNYPKFRATSPTPGEGDIIYIQTQSSDVLPGYILSNSDGNIIKNDINLYDVRNEKLVKKEECQIIVTDNNNVVQDPANNAIYMPSASPVGLPGLNFYKIYNDVVVNGYPIKSDIYKDQKVKLTMEWNVIDFSDTSAPFYKGAPFSTEARSFDYNAKFKEFVTSNNSTTNYNYVKNQLSTEAGINNVFAAGNVKLSTVLGDAQEEPIVVSNPTTTNNGVITQIVYFNSNGESAINLGVYRGARGYGVEIKLPGVKPERYKSLYDRYIGYNYPPDTAHQYAIGFVTPRGYGYVNPTLQLFAPPMYRPLPDISDNSNLAYYGKNSGIYPYIRGGARSYDAHAYQNGIYRPLGPLSYTPKLSRDNVKIKLLAGPSANFQVLGSSDFYDGNKDWPFNYKTIFANAQVQNIMGAGGFLTNGKTWEFVDEYLTDVEINRTELNGGDGVSNRDTNYWEHVTQ